MYNLNGIVQRESDASAENDMMKAVVETLYDQEHDRRTAFETGNCKLWRTGLKCTKYTENT